MRPSRSRLPVPPREPRSPDGAGPRATIAVLLVVAAAVCFGTTGTAQALGAPDADPISLGAARIVIGGALLALLALPRALDGQAGRARRLVARLRPAGTAPSILIVIAGAIGVAAYQPTFFTGTAENGVAVGTIVALGSAPVLTGILEWIVTRRAPGARWFVATSIAALGVVALSGLFALSGGADAASGAGASAGVSPLGLAGSLGAGASYAVYAVCSKQLLGRGWAPASSMGALFGGAALLMLPVLLGSSLDWIVRPAGLATVAWLAIVTVALAYTLFARGLRSLPAATTSTVTLAEPVTATLLGVLVLRETLTLDAVLGVALLVVAVVVLTVPARRREASVP